MDQLRSIWNEVLKVMTSEVAQASFDAWLKHTKPSRLEGSTLYITVPNEFTRDWVEARYTLALRKTLRHIINENWELRFEVDAPQQAPEQPERREVLPEKKPAKPTSDQHPEPKDASILNSKYTFDTFVVGNSNRFAHAASLAVAEAPARAYNPLFLYGGVGLGKTHLMHAIGHYALEKDRYPRYLYYLRNIY